MVSTNKINMILELTAEAFSEPPQSEMLAFLAKRKEEHDYVPSEEWFQCEIARKFDNKGWSTTFKNKKKRDCDFIIDDIGIELKISTSFTYKGNRRLFDAIKRQHKNADCWMLITKYDKTKMRNMSDELCSDFPDMKLSYAAIPCPKWCVIVVARKSDP